MSKTDDWALFGINVLFIFSHASANLFHCIINIFEALEIVRNLTFLKLIFEPLRVSFFELGLVRTLQVFPQLI